MKTAFRYDTASITPLEHADGFLRARVAIARPGVFPYLHQDGQIRFEAKLPEEIFSEITIATAKGAPVTDGHPPIEDNRGLVTPQNYKKHVKGALGDSISVVDGLLSAEETIFDADLMADLKANKKIEASIGFETDVEMTEGEFEGQRYDAVQRNIRINHVAHVEQGRAGESVRAYLDSSAGAYSGIAVMQHNISSRSDGMDSNKKPTEDKNSDRVIFEGMRRFFASLVKKDDIEGAAEGVGEAQKQVEQTPAPKSPDEAQKQAEEIALLKAQVQALQAMLDEKNKILAEATAPATQDAAINTRLELVEIARSLVPDFKQDGLSNRDIKLKVIEKTLPFEAAVKTDSVSDVIVDARFEAAASLAREKAAIRADEGSSSRLDEAGVMKKREGRLNLCESAK